MAEQYCGERGNLHEQCQCGESKWVTYPNPEPGASASTATSAVASNVCRGWSGLNQIICESVMHIVGQAQHVAGCCRGRPSVYLGECLRTGIIPGCSKMKQLSREGRRERSRDIYLKNVFKKKEITREGRHPDWQSAV